MDIYTNRHNNTRVRDQLLAMLRGLKSDALRERVGRGVAVAMNEKNKRRRCVCAKCRNGRGE